MGDKIGEFSNLDHLEEKNFSKQSINEICIWKI